MKSPTAPPPNVEPAPIPGSKNGSPARTAREAASYKATQPTLVGRLISWTLLLAVVAGGWHYRAAWLPWVQSRLSKPVAGPAKGPPRVTPVVAAPVTQRDLELYLNGLGTVTALNTVTVRSRVEGEITNVAYSEGQMVKEGDLLAEIDPRPFERQRDQAKGAVARDEAALNLAKLNLKRQEDLLKSSATTQAQYDLQYATVAQAQAQLETNEAILETAELQLSYCRIIAPISGRVGLRMVDKGNMVRANDPSGIVVITQLEPIGVVFTIPQDEIPRVQKRIQEEKELVVDAFDRDFRNKLAGGRLLAIDNQVDATTGTLRLKAEFKNELGTLFPNQFVNARLAVETVKKAFVIPSAAVQRGPEGPFVYLAKPDDTVELRMIGIGPSQGNEISVQTGLALGDMVVTDGVDKLQPGAKISYRGSGKTADTKPGSGKPDDSNAARPASRPTPEKRKA
ncbi:MAG TPA: efflux RND transporter periplasmic adaptor subunit [Caulifigura sp.]|nr:efflux RND transporter periplasmic adaptor subunit [Caulifigura sp.]